MESLTLRSALQYLWDQGYSMQSVASAAWELCPPQRGIFVPVPPVVCGPTMLIDVALLHQMMLSQAVAAELEHQLHRQVSHAVVSLERLRWQVRSAGKDRWLLSSERRHDRDHVLNGQVVGNRRLWSGAMELERAAIALGVEHIRKHSPLAGDPEQMVDSFLDG